MCGELLDACHDFGPAALFSASWLERRPTEEREVSGSHLLLLETMLLRQVCRVADDGDRVSQGLEVESASMLVPRQRQVILRGNLL
jgi:hypothetical protein